MSRKRPARRWWQPAAPFDTALGLIDAVRCPICDEKVIDTPRNRGVHTKLRHLSDEDHG